MVWITLLLCLSVLQGGSPVNEYHLTQSYSLGVLFILYDQIFYYRLNIAILKPYYGGSLGTYLNAEIKK